MAKKITYTLKTRNPVSGFTSPVKKRSVVWARIVAEAERLATLPENRGQDIIILKLNRAVSPRSRVSHVIDANR